MKHCLSGIRVWLALAGWIVLSSPLQAAYEYEYWSDNFNDGVRNNLLWNTPTKSRNDAFLEELNGHLVYWNTWFINFFDQWIRMDSKLPLFLQGQDALDIQMLVCCQYRPGYALGIGLADAQNRWTTKFIRLNVGYDNDGKRQLNLRTNGGITSSNTYEVIPATPHKIVIRMHYSAKTQKATFFWARPGSTTWNRTAMTVKLGDIWGLNGVRTLRPFVYGETVHEFNLLVNSGIYYDDFRCLLSKWVP